jgi:hypothetical protein
MPRHQPLGRPSPDEVLDVAKVKLRRTPDGKLVPVMPERRTTETTESKPEPRDAPDPRTANQRNIPPYGGGI